MATYEQVLDTLAELEFNQTTASIANEAFGEGYPMRGHLVDTAREYNGDILGYYARLDKANRKKFADYIETYVRGRYN